MIKSLVWRKKVKTTDKNGEVIIHTSRKTYFIYIYFIVWLVNRNHAFCIL